MAYTPQEWENGVEGGTPINAVRLTHIEEGLDAAATVADDAAADATTALASASAAAAIADDAAADAATATSLAGTANATASAASALASAAQPSDSDLTAIAALSTTSYGRSLLTLADQAALLAAAGAQASDSDLTSIAALTTTSYGRALLTLADQAALLAAAGAQASDSDLTSIAALTTTSYGRAFLTLANQAALMALVASGTTSAQGILELSTDAEAIAGTDTARATTPANVKAAAVPRVETFSVSGAAAGYQMLMNIDFSAISTDKEPWMVNAKNAGGTLLRATWLNEAGALRTRSVMNEEALKLFGPGGGYAGVLFRIQDKWESTRTDIYAIDAAGRPRVGSDSTVCQNVWVGETGDTIPSTLPDNTVIVFVPAP